MSYASKAQQRLFHANPPKGITPEKVKEFDEATKGHYAQLPEHAVHAAAAKAAKNSFRRK